MAQPLAVTYTVASGPINAGRFADGAFSGAVALGDATPGGGWAVQQSSFAGAVGLDDAVPGGGITGFVPQNVRVALWGQSNAVGRANRSEISTSPLNADPGLAAFDAGTFDRVWIWNGSAYVKLQPSSFNGATVIAGQFGAEFGLAVRWMRETPAGNLYIDKNAEGGISITEFAPPSGTWYAIGATEASQATTWLASNSVTINNRALLWIQGETDSAQTQSWYETRLTTLIAAMRADGVIGSTSLAVLAQMPASSTGYGQGVFDAKAAYAASSGGAAVTLQMPGYLSDGVHLSGRGMVQHAYDAYRAIFGGAQINV